MKKVISALTAAAMCASMAGIMTASAVYSDGDVGYELRVKEASAGTVVDDNTIKFDSGKANGAKITVWQYINVASTANPSVQQLGAQFTVSDPAIKLVPGPDDYKGYYGEAQTYTNKDDKSFSTDYFVTTFDYLNLIGKYSTGTGSITWGHSDDFPASWKENLNVDVMSYNWQYCFKDNTREDGTKTAAYLGKNSDDFPIGVFTAELGDLADGTYEITFEDTQYNPDRKSAPTNWVQVDDVKKVKVGDMKGITIIVGDGSTTPDKPTEAPDKPTEAPDTPTEAPTQGGAPNTGGNTDASFSDFTWYVKDSTYDPEEGFATIEVAVAKDPGVYSIAGGFLMDGKIPSANGWVIVDVAVEGAYSDINQFTAGMDEAVFAGAVKSDKVLQDLVAGPDETILIMYLSPMNVAYEDMPAYYEISLTDLKLANYSEEKFTAKSAAGKLYIKGKEGTGTDPTEAPTEDPNVGGEATEAPTQAPTQAPTSGEVTPGNYLYGDVNKNNKVELVDVVMLNRFITGYDNQDLDDYQVVVANCYRAKGESDAESTKKDLDGNDSVEILKYLIEKITSLPTTTTKG